MPAYETPTIFVPYHEVDTLTRRGPRAAQPPADEVTPGTLYFVIDEGVTERSDGVVWAAYSAAAGGGVPGPHAPSHQPGGSDPLAVDAAAAVGSLRTLGPGATQAAPGNDPRFSAPPVAHHATHEPGGGDALVGAAWLPLANTFTAPQRLSMAAPILKFNETGAPANARLWHQTVSAQGLRFQTWPDDESAIQSTPFRIDRLGNAVVAKDVYEKGRAAPMGHYTSGDCATFMAPAGVTGPIHWAFVGKTMFLAGIGTMNFGAPVAGITLTLPDGAAGLLAGWTIPLMSYIATAPGWQTGFASGAGGTTLTLYPFQQVAWPAGTSYVSFSLVFPIQ